MNVRQKPVAALVYKRGGRGILPVIPPIPAAPDPPEGIGDYALGIWEGFWSQPTAGLVNLNRDHERLNHWIRAVHERHRLWALWSANPLVREGPNLRMNPLFRQISRLTDDIERAEAHFGMTPLAKMRLTGALDQAEAAEVSIKARREGRAPKVIT